MTFDAGTPRERHVQRVSKLEGTEHMILDFILRDSAMASMLDDRVRIELPEGALSVVGRAKLIAMKRLAGRPQDVADIEKLERDDED